MHCCESMTKALTFDCGKCKDGYGCPDVLIRYVPKFDEYGIIYHDGGTSFCLINFCPWCGIKLPESKRDLWFDTLEAMGFDDPAEQEIPEEYNSDMWYRNK